MLDGIIEFWRNLPWIIKFPLDFFLTVIVLRGIVANEISNWLKERGIMKDGILHSLARTGKRLVGQDDRRVTIFNHYKEHGQHSIVSCRDGQCTLIG